MSQRERWIIYPLLFIAFAMSFRDQWPPGAVTLQPNRLEARVVKCERLEVTDANGNKAVLMSGTQQGNGLVQVFGVPLSPHTYSKLPAIELRVAGGKGVIEQRAVVAAGLEDLASRLPGGSASSGPGPDGEEKESPAAGDSSEQDDAATPAPL